MAQIGYLTARIYTSNGNLPVEGAIVTVWQNVGGRQNILGKRTTDRNGLTTPISIEAPDKSLSLEAGQNDVFSVVDARVDKEGYYTVVIKNVQIFSGETTVVDTPLIPLPDNQKFDDKADEFVETPQNL